MRSLRVEKRGRVVPLVVAGVFLGLGVWRVVGHALWRDEWHHWLYCVNHRSFWGLIGDLGYEGHPGLWVAMLWPLARLTGDPLAMQLLNVVAAAGGVFVLWRWGPFWWVEKVLWSLGYFVLFEYTVIARDYALGLLLALGAAGLYRRAREGKPLGFAVVVFLLVQTSLYGLVVAGALMVALGVDWWGEGGRVWRRERVIAVGVVLLAVGAFYLQTRPAGDARGLQTWANWNGRLHPAEALATLGDAYVPWPAMGRHWWNGHLLPWPDWARGLMGAGMAVGLGAALLRRRGAVALMGVGTAGVWLVTLVVYTGSMRHWGHYVIVLMVAVWVERAGGWGSLEGAARAGGRLARGLFVAFLGVQAVGGVMATCLDLRYRSFSAAGEAAREIEGIERRDGRPVVVVGDFDYALTPVAGELGREVYMVRSGRWADDYRVDARRRRNVTRGMIEEAARKVAGERRGSEVLVVMSYPVYLAPSEFALVEAVPAGTVGDEGYWIYRYRG